MDQENGGALPVGAGHPDHLQAEGRPLVERIGQGAQGTAGVGHAQAGHPWTERTRRAGGQRVRVQHRGCAALHGLGDIAVPVCVLSLQGREQPSRPDLPGIVGQAENRWIGGGVELQNVQITDQLAESHLQYSLALMVARATRLCKVGYASSSTTSGGSPRPESRVSRAGGRDRLCPADSR